MARPRGSSDLPPVFLGRPVAWTRPAGGVEVKRRRIREGWEVFYFVPRDPAEFFDADWNEVRPLEEPGGLKRLATMLRAFERTDPADVGQVLALVQEYGFLTGTHPIALRKVRPASRRGGQVLVHGERVDAARLALFELGLARELLYHAVTPRSIGPDLLIRKGERWKLEGSPPQAMPPRDGPAFSAFNGEGVGAGSDSRYGGRLVPGLLHGGNKIRGGPLVDAERSRDAARDLFEWMAGERQATWEQGLQRALTSPMGVAWANLIDCYQSERHPQRCAWCRVTFTPSPLRKRPADAEYGSYCNPNCKHKARRAREREE